MVSNLRLGKFFGFGHLKGRNRPSVQKVVHRPFEKTNSSNGEKNCQLLREEIIKMEKKLANANEEKEYYKRHFHGEQNGGNING
uniref:Uncharacterized protein n=1 Tax=Meloidogyne javanica TaxID=6303 RepID=A0A915MME7_MELJA